MIRKPERNIEDILKAVVYCDTNLKISDRAILMTLLFLDDDYSISPESMSRLLKYDSESVKESMKRLEENGYLKIITVSRYKKDIDLTPLDSRELADLFFEDAD